ncbi:uncharacterized protein TNCV_4288731 [Trichonephila clavipes]|nr:uncharacterized protein TNCV_4288731 [Trichonephila clavipes]
MAVVLDFPKRILFSDEAHFWLNGYVNKQNGRIWSEANPQVCVETPLHPEKLTVWCALWAGGIIVLTASVRRESDFRKPFCDSASASEKKSVLLKDQTDL